MLQQPLFVDETAPEFSLAQPPAIVPYAFQAEALDKMVEG